MKNKTINIIIGILLIATFVGILIVYNKLPSTIPIHWNIKGDIDGWGKTSSIWTLFLTQIGVNLLFVLIPKIDPKKENYKRFERLYAIFILVFNILFSSIIAITISVALGNTSINVSKIIPFLVGIMFAIIGNYMPKFKHNYTMGIKTPWTLASESVWNRTHRMAAPIWVVGGILMAILPLFLNANYVWIAYVVIIAAIVLIPTIYSYVIFNQEKNAGK